MALLSLGCHARPSTHAAAPVDAGPPAAAPVAGAAPTDAGAATSTRKVSAPVAPGAVRVVIDAEPIHLNPDLDADRWGFSLAWDAIYEPLIRPSPAGDGSFVPVLAERFSVDEDGRRITFHLRRGVRFHDDKPLTPSDVRFTFERLQAARTHAPRVQAELADLERVEIATDTVRLWAKRPSVYLLAAVAEIGILPEHVFERGDLMYQPANRRPVGTGPFRLKSWDREGRGHLVLERFPGYWGPPARAPIIDVRVDDDGARSLGRAKRGELDVLPRVPPLYVADQLDSPMLRETYEVVRLQPARFTFVLWNERRAPLDDVRVREAFALAIDRGRLVAEVRHGLGHTIQAPGLGGSVERTATVYEPSSASAALDAAGLKRLGEGPRSLPSGRPWRLSLLVPSGSREADEVTKRLVASLAKIGVAVDVERGDLATIFLRLRRGTFDAALLEWSGRSDEDLSPLFATRGAQNWGGYSSRAVDQLLEALRQPAPVETRRRLYGELAAALSADPPALFLYAPEEVMLYARRLGPPPLVSDLLLWRDVGPPAATTPAPSPPAE